MRAHWILACSLLWPAGAFYAQTINRVVNAASFEPRLAPGMLALVFGTNLGTSTSTPVLVGGKAAAVLQASPAQFTIQIPFEAATGPATVQVGDSAPFNITLSQYAPALFTADSSGSGNVLALDPDGNPVNVNNLAFPGETISIFATGLGPTVPPLATGVPGPTPPAVTAVQPSVLYASETATVLSSAMAPGQVGVYQITMRLTPAPVTGIRNIGLTIGGVSSGFNVTIPVGAAWAKPAISRVISATGVPGTYQEKIQSGSWVAIYGSDLSVVTRDWTGEITAGRLPKFLTGISVTIDGKLAALYYISPGQINAQAPDVTPGPVPVVVRCNGATSELFTAQAKTHAPAFFQWGATKYAVATRHPDGAYIGGPELGAPWAGARPGDILVLWATGFGPTEPPVPAGTAVVGAPSTVTLPAITVGGVDAKVFGAALSPGLAGVYQIAIQVPSGVAAGDVLVKASIAGFATPDGVHLYLSP